MRLADPNEVKQPAEPVLLAQLSPERFRKLFPVPTRELNALAAAEPSEGALIELAPGGYVVLSYGRETQTLTVSAPAGGSVGNLLRRLLDEVPLERGEIVWTRPSADEPVRRGFTAVSR